ncbi:type II toxin-antitoxin system HipA family toxin [Desulfonatronospira sp.]|uniref:type II toxin-antitoxin system HipA family toxin n=1 Tax=Desulfonatronospira sp. TaxID=1962951 RepID=UPI0025C16C5C|nr:type II toxin-antitoxin system HipA family toxin [Desulfonatronospira sp.]
MMISKSSKNDTQNEVYVWIWLPNQTHPVVDGRLAPSAQGLQFNYGRSYLERKDAIPIYLPELPLQPGVLPLPPGLSMPGSLRDASPDAWGRRVIMNCLLGIKNQDADTARIDELTYMLESGSDRVGAVDFQASPSEYVPRMAGQAKLEQLLEAADRVEKGMPLPWDLEKVLIHGTSLGGARPKALLDSDDAKYIAKFSSSTDFFPVVKAEFIAMRLAALCGIDVAGVKLVKTLGKDVLLVQRFDRRKCDTGWLRKGMISALTLLELDEMMARYASYEDLAEIVRYRFTKPKATLRELFSRLVFNVLCSNTDDHARNHAAFWDGSHLSLTPAYDICPQLRTGQEATQAMLISGHNRFSRLDVCRDAAQQFLLSKTEAQTIMDHQIETIHQYWNPVCEEAELPQADKNLLWSRQFLNPYSI